MNTIKNKMISVMIGHAVGDALGVPAEFASREEMDANPVTDMEGFGTYPYPAGTWSDDTSMSLAALDSLADDKVDWDEIMNNFGKWLEDGEYTPSGEAFDVGRTCLNAIISYFTKGTSVHSPRVQRYFTGRQISTAFAPFSQRPRRAIVL